MGIGNHNEMCNYLLDIKLNNLKNKETHIYKIIKTKKKLNYLKNKTTNIQ